MFAREFSNLQCLMSEDRGSIYVSRVKIIENRMCSMGSRLFAQLSLTLKGNDSIDRTLFSAEASENREREKRKCTCSDVEREEERLLPLLPSHHLQHNYYLLFFCHIQQ